VRQDTRAPPAWVPALGAGAPTAHADDGPDRDTRRRSGAATASRLLAVSLSLVLAALARTTPAEAQGQDEPGARALFNDGRQLEKAGHYEEACSKFDAARRLFTSSGLLLNLADCHERLNRTASAWTEFGDAAVAAANAARPKDEAEAKRRQAALEGRLSRLAIRVNDATADQVVKRDGVLLDRAAWDSPIPVDPGTHAIAAEAPGRSPWSTAVEVREPGRTMTIEIPRLSEVVQGEPNPKLSPPRARSDGSRDAPPLDLASANATDPSADSRGRTQRLIGLGIGVAGVLGMGASGVMGLVAKSQFDTASAETGPARHTDSVRARELSDAASVVLAAGAAVTIAGAVVWWTAPKARISVGVIGAGVLLSGSIP
jgi:hypothetical protein